MMELPGEVRKAGDVAAGAGEIGEQVGIDLGQSAGNDRHPRQADERARHGPSSGDEERDPPRLEGADQLGQLVDLTGGFCSIPATVDDYLVARWA